VERIRIALDCETFLIGKDAVFPKVVCVTVATLGDKTIDRQLYTDAQPETLLILENLLKDPNVELVGCNMKYDLACIKNTWPHLTPLVWQALADGRVTDVVIREKLLNLTTTGVVDMAELPDGSFKKLKYSLNELVQKYLGLDLTKEKEDPDAWRTRYSELSGKLPEEYPEAARDYALLDAEFTLMVAAEQDDQEQNPEGGPASMYTQYFQTAVDFALGMFTENGFYIDPDEVEKVEKMLEEELAPEKMRLLIKSGALRPAEPPRPYANGAVDKETGEPKMTKGKKESINKKILQEIVRITSEDHEIEVKMTEPSEKFPEGQISTSSEVIEELAPLNPVLKEYFNRQKVMKLQTSYIPNLKEGIVHANYDVLKETGRTSSFGGDLYPSWNGQQVDPRVRGCCVPRDGHLLVSADYSAIELVSLAQTIYSMFGHSTLRDLIMQGVDPHAYLGAQLAYHLDQEIGFRAAVQAERAEPDQMFIYSCFLECKTSDDPELVKFYKHYRKLAKPVGLGYPGGLGPDTCMGIAKDTYGIEGDIEMFIMLRDIWHDTFPEMKDYFDFINKQAVDPANPDRHCYMTPLGMYRAGASYCAAANGMALQSPTAEGAKGAVFDLARACCDPSEKSILYGERPLLFIHDEAIMEIKDDELAHERCMEISRLMEQAMGAVLCDMEPKVEPALMRRWNKAAEPVFENDRLVVWEPSDD